MTGLAKLVVSALFVASQVVLPIHADTTGEPSGPTRLEIAPGGDATTTYYLDATIQSPQHSVGVLSSIVDTFINGGTTTEYMTQHLGTSLSSMYVKVATTSSREYYRISPSASVDYNSPARPTGLIGSSTSLEVNGPTSTFFTVEEYRTYVDGHYAHLVSSMSHVVTDPAYITPTPVFGHPGDSLSTEFPDDEAEIRRSLYSSYDVVKPSKAYKYHDGVATKTIGTRTFVNPFNLGEELSELENEIESELWSVAGDESVKRPRQIDLDDLVAVESETNKVEIEPSKPDTSIPTFTVDANGDLNIPTPQVENVSPEPRSNDIFGSGHRFAPGAIVAANPTKVSLDTVTYVGFVDFTTTIDDTVVIFRPKNTIVNHPFGGQKASIAPTSAFSTSPASQVTIKPEFPGRQRPAFQPKDITPTGSPTDTTPNLESGVTDLDESIEDITTEQPSSDQSSSVPGINRLKALLASRSISRNSASRTRFNPFASSSTSSVLPAPSSRLPIGQVSRPGSASASVLPQRNLEESTINNNEILSSIDPTSDVELIFKTLYTTYTYLTTFFRESTTRVKSSKEVISNVITLTNILKSDFVAISSSCAQDSQCTLQSPGNNEFTSGFIGRPNTGLPELPRSSGLDEFDDDDESSFVLSSGLGQEVEAVLETFYTTYTYFSTLYKDGTSTVSTRTEVYSNVQTTARNLPLTREGSSRRRTPLITTSPTEDTPAVVSVSPSRTSPRRLEISSVNQARLQSDLTTPSEADETTERQSTDRVRFFSTTDTTQGTSDTTVAEAEADEVTEVTTGSPSPVFPTTEATTEVEDDEYEDDEEDIFVVTQDSSTEETTEVITTASSSSSTEDPVEDVAEEQVVVVEPSEAVAELKPKPLYITYTYFTTLFKDGTSTVTSNMETVTSLVTDPDSFIAASSTAPEPSVTFFTTFTYWTTSIEGESTVITSREETITDILPASVTSDLAEFNQLEMTEAPELNILSGSEEEVTAIIEPTIEATAEPVVYTFFSTKYDGDSNVVETILSTASLASSTETPELSSGEPEVEVITSSAILTPEVAASIQPTSSSFADEDDDDVLTEDEEQEDDEDESDEDAVKSRIRGRISSFSRPTGNLFTPVIRPLLANRKPGRLFRPNNLKVSTTVATRFRNSVKPTLIATPVSSVPQATPSFVSSSRALASASLFSRGQSRFSSSLPGGNFLSSSLASGVSSSSSTIAPSPASSVGRGTATFTATVTTEASPSRPVIISNLGLRRPNPFRARLRERQQERLEKLREQNANRGRGSAAAEPAAATTPAPSNELPIGLPALPAGIAGGNAPIFISAQRQPISSRRPKDNDGGNESEEGSNSGDGGNIRVPQDIAQRRERAREKIKALFSKRRLLPFGLSTALNGAESGDTSDARQRKKRQVGSSYPEFGSRTQARQSYILRRSQSFQTPSTSYYRPPYKTPFTAFSSQSTNSRLLRDDNSFDLIYDYEDTDSAFSSSNSDSNIHSTFRRQAPSDDFSSRSRSRARSRFRGSSSSDTPPSSPASSSSSSSSSSPASSRGRTRFRDLRIRDPVTTTPKPTTPPPRTTRFRTRNFSSNNRNPFSTTSNTRTTSGFSSSRNRFGSTTGSSDSGRSFNRFSSSAATAARNSLFSRPQVVEYDYDDYYEYSDTDLQSSQGDDRVPDYITVTHQVPIATRIPVVEFGRTELRDILSTSPSLEVIAVTALKSTDINNSPVIYANAQTVTAPLQPGVKDVLFDALRATETTSIEFTPTVIRGRRTSFSHIIPSTIYNVETVTTQVVEPVDQNQLLNSLIQQLLLGQVSNTNPNSALNPLLNPQQAAIPVPQTPATQLVTHTSTYVTTLTEETSTVLPITLRGRPITTTIFESSTKVVTATEYSTETIINSVAAAVVPTPVIPQIAATPPPAAGINPGLASLLPALLGTSPLGGNDAVALAAAAAAQKQQQQLLLQQQQQEALLLKQQEALLAKKLQEQQEALLLQQQEVLNEQLLAKINLDDLSDEDLASLDDVLEAVSASVGGTSPGLVFPPKNLFDDVDIPDGPVLATAQAAPAVAESSPKSSVITIFKSGDSPGEFTSLVSTLFLEDGSSSSDSRKRREAVADVVEDLPAVLTTALPSLLIGKAEARADRLDFLESGLVSEIETRANPSAVWLDITSSILQSD